MIPEEASLASSLTFFIFPASNSSLHCFFFKLHMSGLQKCRNHTTWNLKKHRETSNVLAGLLDLKQILPLSRRRKHQLFLCQPHIYEIPTRSAWRIPLHNSSLVCAFSFVENIEILEDHLAELLCNFLLQWKAPHTQNWPIFSEWNTLAETLNSWFPEHVQTGTVVTIIYVLLDMLLFRRRGLPIGLVYLVSTLQTMEQPIPKSEDISEGTAVCGQATWKMIYLKDCSPQKGPVPEQWENCKE